MNTKLTSVIFVEGKSHQAIAPAQIIKTTQYYGEKWGSYDLENGAYIKSTGDGRWYDKDERSYAEVVDAEFEDGEILRSKSLGFVEL